MRCSHLVCAVITKDQRDRLHTISQICIRFISHELLYSRSALFWELKPISGAFKMLFLVYLAKEHFFVLCTFFEIGKIWK